ncbi:MAG TPA: hypothetical protein VIM02_12105 [Rhizomicrobium sp.]
MRKMRKITVMVPRDDLAAAQELTGEGISETVRVALRYLILEKRHPARPPVELLDLARQPFGP